MLLACMLLIKVTDKVLANFIGNMQADLVSTDFNLTLNSATEEQYSLKDSSVLKSA